MSGFGDHVSPALSKTLPDGRVVEYVSGRMFDRSDGWVAAEVTLRVDDEIVSVPVRFPNPGEQR